MDKKHVERRKRFLEKTLETILDTRANILELLYLELRRGDSPKVDQLASRLVRINESLNYCKEELEKCK